MSKEGGVLMSNQKAFPPGIYSGSNTSINKIMEALMYGGGFGEVEVCSN